MPIHIGKIIQTHVQNLRLTQKEFGVLINKNEKTVPNIFTRATMSIDLLITISEALNKDFLSFYYDEEPMKSLQINEVARLKFQVKALTEKTELMIKELVGKQELIDLQKRYLVLVTESLEDYKKKSSCRKESG